MGKVVDGIFWILSRLYDVSLAVKAWFDHAKVTEPEPKRDLSDTAAVSEPRTGTLKRAEKLWPFYPDVETDAKIELWTDKSGMFVRFTGTTDTGESNMRFVGIPNPWDIAAPNILLEDNNVGYFLNALYLHNKATEQRLALEAAPA